MAEKAGEQGRKFSDCEKGSRRTGRIEPAVTTSTSDAFTYFYAALSRNENRLPANHHESQNEEGKIVPGE